jgi:predicted enzyme related to lactoylglutathione lyase
MPRVVHFEIHAEKPERAMVFYQRLFGWTFQRYGNFDYWLIATGEEGTPGINGALMPRTGAIDGRAIIAYVCSVDVDDIDASIKQAEAAGGEIIAEKNAIPGVGWNAYAKDTEGNIFGMFQSDESAR